MLITLECPDCTRWTVFNERGRCRCGSYLIRGYSGRSMPMPAGRVWIQDGAWKLLKSGSGEEDDPVGCSVRHLFGGRHKKGCKVR
ncbi:hypothetical protein LCGC14_1802820 [marine sediment metagenome]|uniref:Uncharacterized protein n=1 Tax=marine sediment metagenome TaxID=412755 RepID=A0A0F9JNQ5_9ZZZZ